MAKVERKDLYKILCQINLLRAATSPLRSQKRSVTRSLVEGYFEIALSCPLQKLACYGSLSPGAAHHGILEGLKGRWSSAFVRGMIWEKDGFSVFRWDPRGPRHRVYLFRSSRLPRAWHRIDRFEGRKYVRLLVPVMMPGGRTVVANIYHAR